MVFFDPVSPRSYGQNAGTYPFDFPGKLEDYDLIPALFQLASRKSSMNHGSISTCIG